MPTHLEGLPQRSGLEALQRRPNEQVRQRAAPRDLHRRGDADAAQLRPFAGCVCCAAVRGRKRDRR